MTTRQHLLLSYLRAHPRASFGAIIADIGGNEQSTRATLRLLEDRGLVRSCIVSRRSAWKRVSFTAFEVA